MSVRPEIHFNFKKWIGVLLAGAFVSMFFFPFSFMAFPVTNTKNILAGIGLVFLFMTMVYKREFSIPRGILVLLVLSAFVSIASLLAINYNHTPDAAYVAYIRAAIIWLSAAYVACMAIYWVHGRIDLELVLNYLIGVCVFQCVIALLIDFNPTVKAFVDAQVMQGQDILTEAGRLYGIGAFLDIAGSRFAAVLIALAVYIDIRKEELSFLSILLYLIGYIVISVVGNMIARTTLVGMVIGLAYLVFRQLQGIIQQRNTGSDWKIIGTWLFSLGLLVPLAIMFYYSSEQFNARMRFGFEGFFSLAETGEWNVSSNNMLESMIVFPEDLKTWVVGDGYFDNQKDDINYLGNATEEGYYMGTDIGYLRFIFYFGLIGLVAISLVMIYAAFLCADAFPEYKTLFWLACLANFVIWLKVSTDLFLFFCPFICASIIQDTFNPEEEEKSEVLEE